MTVADIRKRNAGKQKKPWIFRKWRKLSQSSKALVFLFCVIVIGFFGIILHASGLSNARLGFAVGCAAGGASLFFGGMLGFLFGIPRTLQRERNEEDGASNPAETRTSVEYAANTNLEQISDWLTKMLVGVGLVQLTALPSHLVSVSNFIAKGLGANDAGAAFAMLILVYFSIAGFLFGYLWTRLYLAGALRRADARAIGNLADQVQQANQRIDDVQRQSELDVRALNIVNEQLNSTGDDDQIPQDELDNAVKLASSQIRVQIFNLARNSRKNNWRNNEPLMAATIPVFRALIKSDVDRKFHRNHAQLGYALRDKTVPEWTSAFECLSTAIDIRGQTKSDLWRIYEFNRAVCRIMLDEAYDKDAASDSDTRVAIIADLRVAMGRPSLRKIVRQDEIVKKWMTLNGVSKSELDSNG